MLCLRKNKYHIAAALLTAVLLCPCSENFNKTSNLLAWWGTIYPQFCFMEAPRTENGQKAEPRFHFWIVETLLFAKNTSRNVTDTERLFKQTPGPLHQGSA